MGRNDHVICEMRWMGFAKPRGASVSINHTTVCVMTGFSWPLMKSGSVKRRFYEKRRFKKVSIDRRWTG